MSNETTHLTLAAQVLRFVNQPGLYPVNQYQSLLLARACELGALLVAARRGRPLAALAAWEPCCGGGPAAVALKRLGLADVQATDINERALEACQANAARNGVALDRVALASLLEDGGRGRFDLIACNPPCGVGESGAGEGEAIQVAVRGGDDGMELTLQLVAQAAARLTPGGALLLVVVSTGNVRRLAACLDQAFPGRWRTFPTGPVAAPYAPKDDPRVARLQDPALGFEPLVWERPDGWVWRLTWIIEATTDATFVPDVPGGGPPRPGFALCPVGHEVAQDPALATLIDRASRDGFWLAAARKAT